jgi:pyrroline-5-carboxylate reductase
MRVLVLGAGKMVEAILEGLKNETDLSQFSIYSPSGESAKRLAEKIGCHFLSSLEEVTEVDWIWLGHKPQQLPAVAEKIRGKFQNAIFVSMLAALSEEDQMRLLGAQKLIRIMPNLPIKYKKGVTLLSSLSANQELKIIESLFSLVGVAQIVSEKDLEELTILTGSGPALFYEFTKLMSLSFESLSEFQRESLSRMVLLGAGISAFEDEKDLSQMIGEVTSKGGVTIAVLNEWRHLKLNELVKNGIFAGQKRAAEMKSLILDK